MTRKRTLKYKKNDDGRFSLANIQENQKAMLIETEKSHRYIVANMHVDTDLDITHRHISKVHPAATMVKEIRKTRK